jgi:hypothetical protein
MSEPTNDRINHPPVRIDAASGRPLFSFHVRGGPLPRDLPAVYLPRMAEFERGSSRDHNRNR